jgi:hypothetical protein
MLKLSKGDFIVWGIFGSILCYAFLEKWGFLGWYLQASPYVYCGLAVYFTVKFSQKIDNFFIEIFTSFYFSLVFKICKGLLLVFTFSFLVYVSLFSKMDRLLISKISGVPMQVLLPCSYRPNPPELEQEIRKTWRIHKLDSIDEFCEREIDTSSSSDH